MVHIIQYFFVSSAAASVSDSDVPKMVPLGVFMLLAWPLAVVCGIFMTTWMKPALPRGEWLEVSWLVIALCAVTVYKEWERI